jgi:cobalt-zinc-cadmium efflux system outer membrane protein
MRRPTQYSILLIGLVLALDGRQASAQVALADDIILAAQGKENAERNRESELGHKPGTSSLPYRRSPGSSDILLGADQNRRLSTLPRLSRRPTNPAAYRPPGQEHRETEHGLAPTIERLRLPEALHRSDLEAEPGVARDPVDGGEGPPDGLTLDAAIERFVRDNRDLHTKFLEIPQAEADVLTAGLRANPLLFYSSDSVPYGSYSRERPGEIAHELSVVYPIDFSGKRRSRIAVARTEKRILDAQYLDAVRQGIDDLYTAYVDVLAARQAVRTAERSIGLYDELVGEVGATTAGRSTEADEDDRDDLTIERDLAAMSVGDERARLVKAKHRLGVLLDLSPEEAERMMLRGSIRVNVPGNPTYDSLIHLALCNRPDLIAFRLGVERARAIQTHERAERFSDAYFLYTPFEYRDNSQVGDLSSVSWGAGLFVSAPIFNRNQGNLRRARLNLEQTQIEATTAEHRVIAELREAIHDFDNTAEDLKRLETVTLPAVRRKRDKAWNRMRARTISAETFLAVQRDTSSLVRYYRDTLTRHRRHTLKLNTVVGMRIVP